MYYELWAGESRDYRIWGNGEVQMRFEGEEKWYAYPGDQKVGGEVVRALCLYKGKRYADGTVMGE